MKLEEKTLNVLKNYSQINPSILFKEGNVLATISPTNTILSRAKVSNSFDRRFAVYELHKLLAGISLAETPVLTFNDSSLVITDEKTKRSSTIPYAVESSIKTIPPKIEDKNWDIMPSVDVVVNVTEDDLRSVIRAAGAFNCTIIALVGDGQNAYLKAFNPSVPNGCLNEAPLGPTDKVFSVHFVVENLLKLISGDYRVEISSKLMSHFIGADIEYWVAVETSSTFS
jgi:hypothetical protein